MATGYTRQSSATIQPGQNINAGPLNIEFDTLQAAFDNGSGHDHTGLTPGDGQKIVLTTAVSGILPIGNGGTGAANTGGPAILVFPAGTPTFTFPTTSKTLLANDFSNIAAGAQLVLSGTQAISITGTGTFGVVAAGIFGATIVAQGTINSVAGILDNGNRVISKSNMFGLLLATPVDPAGATTAGVMAGLAQLVTPATTGRLLVIINGNMTNSTPATGVALARLRAGSGAAPLNGGALVGTAIGNIVYGRMTDAVNTGALPFSVAGLITGLTLATQYWIDLEQGAVAGVGTTTLTSLTVTVTEI